MIWMPILSLALNILVLLPVCGSLIGQAAWTEAAFGPATPARGILLSIYLTILLASADLLIHPVVSLIAGLLAAQIIYKITTPITVGTLRNPVVVSNLAIAGFHGATLWSLGPSIPSM
jgi:hypothetical protein